MPASRWDWMPGLKVFGGSKNRGRSAGRNQSCGKSQVTVCGAVPGLHRAGEVMLSLMSYGAVTGACLGLIGVSLAQ